MHLCATPKNSLYNSKVTNVAAPFAHKLLPFPIFPYYEKNPYSIARITYPKSSVLNKSIHHTEWLYKIQEKQTANMVKKDCSKNFQRVWMYNFYLNGQLIFSHNIKQKNKKIKCKKCDKIIKVFMCLLFWSMLARRSANRKPFTDKKYNWIKTRSFILKK